MPSVTRVGRRWSRRSRLASVGGVGAVTEQEKASIRQAAGARRKFEAKFTRRVHRKALPLEPFDGLRRTTAPVEAPPIPPHLQSRHPILQGPIAWSMPGASPHSSVDTYRASPVAAVLTLSGGADDIRRALPDVRSAPAVGDADGGGGDDDGGGPSGAESANSSNDATEVPPSSRMKRTASRDVAAILLSLSPPAQASPLIGPLTTAPHAILSGRALAHDVAVVVRLAPRHARPLGADADPVHAVRLLRRPA